MLLRMITLSAAVVALSACTVSLPQTHRYGDSAINSIAKYDDFQPRVSTVYDVYNTFGQPHEVGKDANGKGTVWRYYFIEENPTLGAYVPVYGKIGANRKYEKSISAFYFHADDTFWDHLSKTDVRKRQTSIASIDATLTQSKITKKVKAEMTRLNLPYKGGQAIQMATMIDMTD